MRDVIHVLVVSDIEWATTNAFGNTISNWFEGMEDITFSCIYRRSSQPINNVCKRYYSISLQSIVRHFLHPELIGKEFSIDSLRSASAGDEKWEKKMIQWIHRLHFAPAYWLEGALFRSKRWDDKNFKNFVLEKKPDIIFSFLTGSGPAQQIINAIMELVPECRQVFFIADDVYGANGANGKRVIRKMLSSADLLYGASEMLCEAYRKQFHVEINPLYKGCRMDHPFIMKEYDRSQAIRIVYAGNLYYGRDDVLAALIKAIQAHNVKGEYKYHLDIYSGTPVPRRYQNLFNDGIIASFHGQKPYETIQAELRAADLVLHVESFEEKWKKVVRYSYSTKITDCLESGSSLLAIGPSGIASIEELRQIPGAIIADDLDSLSSMLDGIQHMDLSGNAASISDFASENRSAEMIQKRIFNDFFRICHEQIGKAAYRDHE